MRSIFQVFLIMILLSSCISWQEVYEKQKIKQFYCSNFKLTQKDTLWVAAPSCVVNIRYSVDGGTKITQLKRDSGADRRVQGFLNAGIEKLLRKKICIQPIKPEIDSSLLEAGFQKILKGLREDSVTNIGFDSQLVDLLKKSYVRYCLLTSAYWWYMDDDLVKKRYSEAMYGLYRSGRQPWTDSKEPPSLIILNLAIVDVDENKLKFFRSTWIETEKGRVPVGYYGYADKEGDYFSRNFPGQNRIINGLLTEDIFRLNRFISKSKP